MPDSRQLLRPSTAPVKKHRLYHSWFTATPSRTLCGRPRDASDPGHALDGSTHPDDCLVCEALASAYIDGKWTP